MEQEFGHEIRIPKERVAIVIGPKGFVKKQIEAETKTKLKIDSREGDVFITGGDGLGVFSAREIISAIGRGFNPEVAMNLLRPEYLMEAIGVSDYAGKSKNDIVRLRGRVIGTEGRSKKTIEELTETNICIYGKTVCIIGEVDRVADAKRAIEHLLNGSPHSNVYAFLEKKRKDIKMKRIIEM